MLTTKAISLHIFNKFSAGITSKLMRRIFLLVIFLIITTAAALSLIRINSLSKKNQVTAVSSSDTTQRIQLNQPKSTMKINKEFNFPVKSDETGSQTIKYLIDSAEKRDEILIKGQKATAIAGHTFLVINIKLSNDSNQTMPINTRNYVRLSVNDNAEWLAPDIHNDPVEVQPISTKYTRLGFPVSDSDKKLKLQIGEISKDKTTVSLNF